MYEHSLNKIPQILIVLFPEPKAREMNYQEAVQWLYARLPVYQRDGAQAYKPGLQRIRNLLRVMNNPHLEVPVVHIAGTNGKGSVAHMLSALLIKHGLKVGLYTSPHLIDLRERFKMNGVPVSETLISDFVDKYREAIEEVDASFFEVCVAMAFHFFRQCDVAIMEVGMGGRLDATNVIPKPLVSVITSIGFDHERFLGRTLTAIAREKAGIIKHGVPVVVGQDIPGDAMSEIKRIARLNNASVYEADYNIVDVDIRLSDANVSVEVKGEKLDLWLPVGGRQYVNNVQTVLKVAEVLDAKGLVKMKIDKTYEAFAMFKDLTGWAGRWDIWALKPLVIADIAHNEQAVKMLAHNIDNLLTNKKIFAVFGISGDKKISHFEPLVRRVKGIYAVEANVPRAKKLMELVEEIKQLTSDTTEVFVAGSVAEGIKQAIIRAKRENAVVLITGSVFVVGEAYEWFIRGVSHVEQTAT